MHKAITTLRVSAIQDDAGIKNSRMAVKYGKIQARAVRRDGQTFIKIDSRAKNLPAYPSLFP